VADQQRRRLTSACAAATACALLASGLGVGSARALTTRGHSFAFAFGAPGSGDGQLSEPAGIAVRRSSGEVFVVDRANNRIEQFRPALGAGGEVVGEHFVAAWGWGVADGKKEYERCTSGCLAGIAGTGRGALKSAEAIAVDNSEGAADHSSGDVYVGTDPKAAHPDVQKFTPSGEEAVGKLKDEEEGRVDGLAIDGSGTVWLYRAEEEAGAVEAFSNAVRNVVEKERRVEPQLLACPKPGLALGEEAFYLDSEGLNLAGECPGFSGGRLRNTAASKIGLTGETLRAALDPQNTTGLASDPSSGAVYVDNGTSVAALAPDGSLIERFGAGQLKSGSGVAVDGKGDVYVADAQSDVIDVFAPAPAGPPSVDRLQAQNLPTGAEGARVRLSAKIDPDGADTYYYFQYGTADCTASPALCTDVPVTPGADIGAGFGDVGVSVEISGLSPATTYHYRVLAENEIEGRPNFAEGATTHGTITTLPSAAGLLADQRQWEMVSPANKDGSGIEAITLEGGAIQAAEDGNAITYLADGPVLGEPQANRSPDPTQVLSTRGQSQWESQDIVTPHEKGEGIEPGEAREYRLFSSDLALSLLQPPDPEPTEHPPLAPGVKEKTIYVRADAPVSPSAVEQAIYAQAQGNGSLAPGYLPLMTPMDIEGEAQFGGKLKFLSATEDLSHVIFESDVPLTKGAQPGDLYEWQAGQPPLLVSVLPAEDGEPEGPVPAEAQLGDEGANTRGALSADGSRIFWMSEEREDGAGEAIAPQLYMRDTATGASLRVSAAQGVREPETGEAQVGYQAASADGSKVFFTDTARLTPESNQVPVLEGQGNPADLYQCEIVQRAGKPACNLKDLTPAPIIGGGEVLNVIPGASQDGSSVYFIANAPLAPGASQGDCASRASEHAPPGATCNLYLWHEGRTTFIAELSNEDSGDWGSLHGGGSIVASEVEERPDLADLTTGVSPNGRYLAFMSQRSLTGYDNEDESSKQPGERLDQEVFLYDSSTDLLRCVSCNPDGRRPQGVLDQTEPRPGEAHEGRGLLVDRRGDWVGSYLAGSIPGWVAVDEPRLALHQPRYLTDSGRLFFNSPSDLTPQAENHREDVYQYEPDGEGSCSSPEGCVALISSGTSTHESAFLDASSSGADAFFITAQPLVSSDVDTNFDVYDARICGSAGCFAAPPPPPPPCESSEGCHPAGAGEPPAQTPATASYSGPGNPPAKVEVRGETTVHPPALTRAQQLAKALAGCRARYKTKKARPKRAACERTAKKRYATKSAPKKKRAKSSRQARG